MIYLQLLRQPNLGTACPGTASAAAAAGLVGALGATADMPLLLS